MASALLLNANYPSSSKLTKETFAEINTNIGNGYISRAVERNFQIDAETIHLCNNIWEERTNHDEIQAASASASIIILILQDQLRMSFADKDYENALKVLRALEGGIPLVVLSLGANSLGPIEPKDLARSLSPTRRRFFEYLSSRSLSLGIRGAFTAQVLIEMGIRNFEVVGCPSYFERGPDRIVENPRTRANYRFVGMAGLQSSTKLQIQHYLQGDEEWPFVELMHAGMSFEAKEMADRLKLNETYLRLFRNQPQQCIQFFANADNWENHIRAHCQLVVGSRVHGSIAALNAGVPAIVTNCDVRARECCDLFGIPWRPEWLHRTDLGIDELVEAADPAILNGRYANLYGGFTKWMKSLGCEPRSANFSISSLPEFEKIDASILSYRSREVLRELRKSTFYSRLTPPVLQRGMGKLFLTLGMRRASARLFDRAERLRIINR